MSSDIENRLVRIETRLVKYQENNVQQLMGIHDAIERLCDALYLLTDSQPKEGNDDEQ
jgi:hypothetical protein